MCKDSSHTHTSYTQTHMQTLVLVVLLTLLDISPPPQRSKPQLNLKFILKHVFSSCKEQTERPRFDMKTCILASVKAPCHLMLERFICGNWFEPMKECFQFGTDVSTSTSYACSRLRKNTGRLSSSSGFRNKNMFGSIQKSAACSRRPHGKRLRPIQWEAPPLQQETPPLQHQAPPPRRPSSCTASVADVSAGGSVCPSVSVSLCVFNTSHSGFPAANMTAILTTPTPRF